MAYTDIRTGIVNRLPPRWRPYALLARLDRPIGTWLLLIPCWWGLALAPVAPPLWYYLLFAVGAIVMRGAGCTINDMWDRDLDAKVERTRDRPLASGALTLHQACNFLIAQLCIGLVVLLLLPPMAIALGAAALLPVAIYPFMKRITWWPQLMLGITFNWGILLGYAAAANGLSPAPLALYGAAIAWTIVYDTIYAHQDRVDDEMVGIKSTAILFGERAKPILMFFALLAFAGFITAGIHAKLSIGYFIGMAFAACHIGWQLLAWHPNRPSDCLAKFRSNRDFALIVLVAILMGTLA